MGPLPLQFAVGINVQARVKHRFSRAPIDSRPRLGSRCYWLKPLKERLGVLADQVFQGFRGLQGVPVVRVGPASHPARQDRARRLVRVAPVLLVGRMRRHTH